MNESEQTDVWTGEPGPVVEDGAAFETLLTGFEFLEGPSWHREQGFLVFSDIIGNRQYTWSPSKGKRIFRSPSNMANGTTWDRKGRLLVCEHATSRVVRLHPGGKEELLASHFEGKELNSPNDIVEKSNGWIYFTDPNSGRTSPWGVPREQQLDFQGVYRFEPRSGKLVLLADDFSKPNGLCFSRDESRLFVNDTDQQHIRVFDVKEDGSLQGGALWASTDGARPGVADGMKFDAQGNLYSSGSGGIHVFSPDGNRLGIIRTPQVAANFNWGGKDMRDLFVTATHTLYRLRMTIPGLVPLGYGPAPV
ncbi:MAG: SMP-30/gluconolactonase/LRE family protein [Xanthomonadales bacterium]|jgi:gluconolactonase|nr:SMP-30/gluconolactonase/LRE family protein [Xanthomonadales bacterium]